jgi:hypothetical protein
VKALGLVLLAENLRERERERNEEYNILALGFPKPH